MSRILSTGGFILAFLWADTPPGRHPLGRHPLPGQTPPQADTPRQTSPGKHPPGRHLSQADTYPRQTRPGRHHPLSTMGYGQQVGSMHPTGMHSCFHIISHFSSTVLTAALLLQSKVELWKYVSIADQNHYNINFCLKLL